MFIHEKPAACYSIHLILPSHGDIWRGEYIEHSVERNLIAFCSIERRQLKHFVYLCIYIVKACLIPCNQKLVSYNIPSPSLLNCYRFSLHFRSPLPVSISRVKCCNLKTKESRISLGSAVQVQLVGTDIAGDLSFFDTNSVMHTTSTVCRTVGPTEVARHCERLSWLSNSDRGECGELHQRQL